MTPRSPLARDPLPASRGGRQFGWRSVALVIVLILVIVGIFAALNHTASTPEPVPSSAVPVPTSAPEASSASTRPELEITSFGYRMTQEDTDNYPHDIVGTLRNNTAKQFDYVVIQVNQFARDGAVIASTPAIIRNLEPHATWKFHVPMDPNALSYKVVSINAR